MPGCANDTTSPFSGKRGQLCPTHWFMLQLDSRRRWWQETDHGKRPPSAELRRAIVAELKGR